jgi:hypothetical protein
MTTGGPSALSFAGKNFPDRINARETHTERERERERAIDREEKEKR